MGLLDNIGDFKIGGSIDSQFRTNNAVERIMIASGEKVNGLTSFLTTLEFIGNILLILTSVLIITTLILIHTIKFIARAWSILFPSKAKRKEYLEIKQLDNKQNNFELTDEDIIEINNFH